MDSQATNEQVAEATAVTEKKRCGSQMFLAIGVMSIGILGGAAAALYAAPEQTGQLVEMLPGGMFTDVEVRAGYDDGYTCSCHGREEGSGKSSVVKVIDAD